MAYAVGYLDYYPLDPDQVMRHLMEINQYSKGSKLEFLTREFADYVEIAEKLRLAMDRLNFSDVSELLLALANRPENEIDGFLIRYRRVCSINRMRLIVLVSIIDGFD